MGHKDNTSSKTSDTFAMVGTWVLWMFWPSFNGALASGSQQHRVVVNTVLSLCASAMAAFMFSAFLRKHHKFDMVDIQNATLAGGVAVGSSSDLVIQPWGALVIGFCAGALSVVGYVYISPWLERKVGLHDTCGIHNLHGMPGIMGAITSAVFMAAATPDVYGDSWQILFGDRNPATEQAPMQIAAMAAGVGIALVGGAMTGLVISMPFLGRLEKEDLYDDDTFWLTE